MTAAPPQVRVGVAAFVLALSREPADNPRFIMGKRLSSHGAGTWALPGGHLEFGESFEECAAREVAEETGLKVRNIRYLTVTNDIMEADNKHYITVFTVCEREDEGQEPEILEPNKCEGWEWWSWKKLLQHAKEADVTSEGQGAGTQLFSPILDLVNQRPGLLPIV